MLNVVIFSKDRPAQLSACIRSFLLYFEDLTKFKLTVVYRAATKEFEAGYKKVFESLPTQYPAWDSFQFINETNIKRNTLNGIDPKRELTMFLVDDILFKAPFSLNDKEVQLVKNNKEIVATSLRLYKGITKCYATDESSPPPKFVKGCVWDWTKTTGDWNYPHSLDGNIYRTDYAISLLKTIGDFNNPNQLEAQLSQVAGIPLYMACYVNESKVINIPANIVQTTFKNRYGSMITVEELNKKFLEEDMVIDIKETVEQAKNNSTVHCELEYKWSVAPK